MIGSNHHRDSNATLQAAQRGVGDTAAVEALVQAVRNTTPWSLGHGLVREERDGVVYWRVG